jgi:hypothetical protein
MFLLPESSPPASEWAALVLLLLIALGRSEVNAP